MTHKTIIEAALNGPWGRSLQPNSPILVDEIITEGVACAKEGASIIHVHAYDPDTGRQNDNAETYASIIEGIREEIPDANVYPTIPLAGSGLSGEAASPKQRFAHVEFLAARGLIELAVVDPGSVNFTWIDPDGKASDGFVYLNPETDVLQGLKVCRERRLRPSYAVYEPGFTRAGADLSRRFTELKTPLYRFMFSDAFAWGFPPRAYALDAHLALLEETAPGSVWMIAGLNVDLFTLVEKTVALGGHVRAGLEDAPLGCPKGNVDLVREMVTRVRSTGGEPATANEARAIMAASDVPV